MYNDTLLFEPQKRQILGMEYTLMMSDHNYLYDQRIAMGLSRKEVADAAGINIRQYQRFESGERSMSSASLRIGLAICDVLKLDPHRFVHGLLERVTLAPDFGAGHIQITRDRLCERIYGELTIALEELSTEKHIADLPELFVFPTGELYGAPAFIQQEAITKPGTVCLRGTKTLSIILLDIERLALDMKIPTQISFQGAIALP